MDQPLLFSQMSFKQKIETESFLDKHVGSRKLKENCKVIDIGCGDGSVTKMTTKFLGNFERLIGLDVSEKMVEFAKSQNKDERVNFVVGNIDSMKDLEDLFGVFDYAVSFTCLHRVEHQSSQYFAAMDNPLLFSKTNFMQKFETESFLNKHMRSRKLKKNCKVIDIGCGDGSVTKMTAKFLGNFERLIGVDVSENMVEFAKSQNEDEKVEFIVGNIESKENLEDLVSVFDYAVSFICLHWIENQSRVWKNIFDILKPGGQVFGTLSTVCSMDYVYEEQRKNNKWLPYMRHCKPYVTEYLLLKNPEEILKKHIKNAGFIVQDLEVVHCVHVYEHEETYRKLVRAVNPYVGKMSEDLVEEYLDDFFKINDNLDLVKSNSQPNQESRTLVYDLVRVVVTKPNSKIN